MNSYYQELIDGLRSEFEAGNTGAACARLENELAMPYIPEDVRTELEKLKKAFPLPQRAKGMPSEEELDELISGSTAQKEKAATVLQKMNLREYHSQVQKLLSDPKLLQEFKGELIEALIAQKIDDEFSMEKDGTEIVFQPSLITPASKDPVYRKALALFDDWFGADNPYLAGFCTQLLDQELLEMRPFDFEGTDPQALAASIALLVFRAMKDTQGEQDFLSTHPGLETGKAGLRIARRPEY